MGRVNEQAINIRTTLNKLQIYEKCSNSSEIREIQIKAILKCHLMPIRLVKKVSMPDNTKCQ